MLKMKARAAIPMVAIFLLSCRKDHCQYPLSSFCDGPCPTLSTSWETYIDAVTEDIGATVVFQCEEPFTGILYQGWPTTTLMYFDGETEELVGAVEGTDVPSSCTNPLFRSFVRQYGHIPTCVEDCALEQKCVRDCPLDLRSCGDSPK